MLPSFEEFMARLGQRQTEVGVIFVGCTFGLLITLLSLPALSPESSARIVAFMNIPGLLFMMSWTGYVLWRFRFNSSLGQPAPESAD
jgi:hypothetical protein